MIPWMILFLWVLAGSVQAHTLQGKVTRVSDGDTLWVAVDSKSKPIKLRLQGMDAPEICQLWGKEAQQALNARLLGQTVSLKILAKDDYHRSLGRITHRGQDVGQWLVREGHAWSYSYSRRAGPYAADQAQAQAGRLGLWASMIRPVEPRQFRQANGPCKP
jgi:endonuclease YncB( thermonuclease family)